MRFIVWILVIIILIAVGTGFYLTWTTQSTIEQKQFLSGTLPDPLPDGHYIGYVGNYSGSWRGKNFDAANARGVDLYRNDLAATADEERYRFKTYIGKGLQDPTLEVLKLDYDIGENPFWMKVILQELVQVDEKNFLGKIHLRIIPNFPFSIDYFRLETESSSEAHY